MSKFIKVTGKDSHLRKRVEVVAPLSSISLSCILDSCPKYFVNVANSNIKTIEIAGSQEYYDLEKQLLESDKLGQEQPTEHQAAVKKTGVASECSKPSTRVDSEIDWTGANPVIRLRYGALSNLATVNVAKCLHGKYVVCTKSKLFKDLLVYGVMYENDKDQEPSFSTFVNLLEAISIYPRFDISTFDTFEEAVANVKTIDDPRKDGVYVSKVEVTVDATH